MSEQYYNAVAALDGLVAASHAIAFRNPDDCRASAAAYREFYRQLAIASAILPDCFPVDDERPYDQRCSDLLHHARDVWRRRARRSKHPCDAVLRDALKHKAPALQLVSGDAA